MSTRAMTVGALREILKDIPDDTQLEFQIPENKYIEDLNKGDRWMIMSAERAWYNRPSNRWLVFK